MTRCVTVGNTITIKVARTANPTVPLAIHGYRRRYLKTRRIVCINRFFSRNATIDCRSEEAGVAGVAGDVRPVSQRILRCSLPSHDSSLLFQPQPPPES